MFQLNFGDACNCNLGDDEGHHYRIKAAEDEEVESIHEILIAAGSGKEQHKKLSEIDERCQQTILAIRQQCNNKCMEVRSSKPHCCFESWFLKNNITRIRFLLLNTHEKLGIVESVTGAL